LKGVEYDYELNQLPHLLLKKSGEYCWVENKDYNGIKNCLNSVRFVIAFKEVLA
jgi:hypothetical protein